MRLHARIHVHARDRVFEHVAVAAEELQAARRPPCTAYRVDPQLGHRRRGGVQRAVDVPLDAAVDEGAADQRSCVATSASLKRVFWNSRSASGRSALRSRTYSSVAAARAPSRPPPPTPISSALVRKLLHQLREALALDAAEQRFRRDAHVVEEKLGRCPGAFWPPSRGMRPTRKPGTVTSSRPSSATCPREPAAASVFATTTIRSAR